jgi:hypothetical protein
MNHATSFERRRGDVLNLSVANAYITDSIESGLGIHDAAAFDDEIVLLCGGNCGKENAKKQQQAAHKRPMIRRRDVACYDSLAAEEKRQQTL